MCGESSGVQYALLFYSNVIIIVELITAVIHSIAKLKYFSIIFSPFGIDASQICQNDNMLAEKSQQTNRKQLNGKTFPIIHQYFHKYYLF